MAVAATVNLLLGAWHSPQPAAGANRTTHRAALNLMHRLCSGFILFFAFTFQIIRSNRHPERSDAVGRDRKLSIGMTSWIGPPRDGVRHDAVEASFRFGESVVVPV